MVALGVIKYGSCSRTGAAGVGHLRRVVGFGPWREQLLYRLKYYACSLYVHTTGFPGCPHAESVRRRFVEFFHVFWTCPAAQRVANGNSHLSLHNGGRSDPLHPGHHGGVGESGRPSFSMAYGGGGWHTSTRSMTSVRHITRWPWPLACAKVTRQWSTTSRDALRTRYMSGLPRGSVVLRVGTDCTGLELCWVCSKAYGPPRTTSNVAESMGLLMGLKACRRNVWASLHVIGDSALILRQQRLRIPHTSEISII
ncbi:hypothetical protein GQ600_19808 [Phytophthora cactorum]|nr:hypothetical protein GQ600_19808 [Phytophthora cactorum]